MSTNLAQPSFSAGELSPSLYARVDFAKYRIGAATMRNMFVNYQGGASTRPGTQYIATSVTPGNGPPPRLVPFQFNSKQSYVLEFGQSYIAVYVGGRQVVDAFGNPFGIPTPYALADVPLLKFTQSADVLTITHPSYVPQNLARLADTNWTLTPITFQSAQPAPSGLSFLQSTPPQVAHPPGWVSGDPSPGPNVAYGDTKSTQYSYVVTAVNLLTGEESVGSPAFINSSGMFFMSGSQFVWNTLTWIAPPGPAPAQYNIYRQEEVPNGSPPNGSLYGQVGSSTNTRYVDKNALPNFAITPPTNQNPFANGNNPSCSCYFQQRLVFAGSNQNPQTFWMTQPGNITNMNTHIPSQPDDAITETIASTQVNEIQAMVPMAYGLIMLSSGGTWQISGGGPTGGLAAPLTPQNVSAQPQSYNGSSEVQPIIVNYDILFIQERGSIVRDLSYNFYVNVYTGADTTILSNHLFQQRKILQWAYAEEPYKLIWCIRDDGILLSLTYMKEQELVAWARHDTNGTFVSVCSVEEQLQSGELVNATYLITRRAIVNAVGYFIERMADRSLQTENRPLNVPANIENSWCLDMALSLPQQVVGQTLFPSFGAETVGSVNVTFLCSAPVFNAQSIGSVIRGNGGKALITSVFDASTIGCTIQTAFPLQPNGFGVLLPIQPNQWTATHPVGMVTGLNYLNGMFVGIVADGNVLPPVKVTGGQVTLPVPASQVVVGLPFQCQLQTLYLDAGEPTIQGKRKAVHAVTARVQDSRGIKAGRTFATVQPIKQWNQQTFLGGPLPLFTGDERINLDPLIDTGGQVCFQIDDPVPATILGVFPEISVYDSDR